MIRDALLNTRRGSVFLLSCSREKDARGSTGRVYSGLGLHVVDTVPAGAGVMQVLLQGLTLTK